MAEDSGSSKKSGVSDPVRTEGDVKHWLVKMAGGPPKVVRSRRQLSNTQLHQAYRDSIVIRGRAASDSPDEEFPICQVMTESDVSGDEYRHLFQPSTVDKDRFPNIVEVK